MATSDAPISISAVTLVVNNLEKMANFYQQVMGLSELSRNQSACTLGQADTVLMHLREDRSAQTYPHEAGLFHTAFLLPDRASLGSWLKHANQHKVRLDGAADHSVSEALYLDDPEGNGVEIYVDRERSSWTIKNELIDIDTRPLNLKKLEAGAIDKWEGMPNGTVIGHVHLQVGDVDAADRFYRDKLGLVRTAQIPHANFYGSGGYHHHIATNTWNSLGALQRPSDSTGLYKLELRVEDPELDLENQIDPWGIQLRFSRSSKTSLN